MNVKLMRRLAVLLPLLVLLLAAGALAQGKITTPKEFLGFDAGDDYIAGELHAAQGLLEEAGPEIRPDEAGGDRQDRRGPAAC